MKCHVSNWKEKNADGIEKMLCGKNFISMDQPFDYEEVVAITGSNYVQNLNYDGVICIPYEELRKNFADFNLPEEESSRMMPKAYDLQHEAA